MGKRYLDKFITFLFNHLLIQEILSIYYWDMYCSRGRWLTFHTISMMNVVGYSGKIKLSREKKKNLWVEASY